MNAFRNVTLCSLGALYQSSKKGTAVPLQVWSGPEGSKRLRLPDFRTIGT
jgi:hypothetical protein